MIKSYHLANVFTLITVSNVKTFARWSNFTSMQRTKPINIVQSWSNILKYFVALDKNDLLWAHILYYFIQAYAFM